MVVVHYDIFQTPQFLQTNQFEEKSTMVLSEIFRCNYFAGISFYIDEFLTIIAINTREHEKIFRK